MRAMKYFYFCLEIVNVLHLLHLLSLNSYLTTKNREPLSPKAYFFQAKLKNISP